MQFSERSRKLRKQFSLTQEEMAERFGVTRAYYGLLESEKKEPSETLEKMLSLLELSAQIHGNLDRFGVVEEEGAAYRPGRAEPDDDPQVNRIIEYTHELIQLSRKCDSDTKGYIMTQLRRHLSLADLAALANVGSSIDDLHAHQRKKIPGTPFELNENLTHREKIPYRPARREGEPPAGDHKASGE